MPFCKYSSSLLNSGYISIDAKFLNDYLPVAPENCVKVYLFGLLKCENSAGYDNTIENFENVLGLTHQQVLDCFYYWQDQNLVKVLDVDPIEVQFLPVTNASSVKKIDTKKYKEFVEELNTIITGRTIQPNEIMKYIDFVESNNVLWCDFLMIVKYCVEKKGNDINSNYILTVAQVWADEGVKTAQKIEEKIESMTLLSSDVAEVAKALKYKGTLSLEHQQVFSKWLKSYGFNKDTIIKIASALAKKGKSASFEKLDKTLLKYYELKLFSFSEIETYEANKSNLISLAIDINKTLGVYYDVVDNEIETYILPWLSKGFDGQSLVYIADFCFKNSQKTLEDMDGTVQKFHKLGITTISSINAYMQELLSVDSRIKEILSKLKIDRRVSNFDRSYYRTWTTVYKYGEDIIDYAIEKSKNKPTMNYVNGILTSWFESGLDTLEKIKKNGGDAPAEQKTFTPQSFGAQNYSREQVSALFDNLDEINI